MLIAFYAVIMLVNHILGWLGSFSPLGDSSINQHLYELSNTRFDSLSLEAIFGFLFAPLAWLIGRGRRRSFGRWATDRYKNFCD